MWFGQNRLGAPIHTFQVTAARLLTDFRSIKSERIAVIVLGGADLSYMAKLSKARNDEIRRAVFDGGSYISICAGAYFGSGSLLV